MNAAWMSFAVWRQRLRDDCVRCDRLLAFQNLGDESLRVLWEAGTEPSVQSVIDGRKDKDWRELCVAVKNETDLSKLSSLVQEMIEALDKARAKLASALSNRDKSEDT